MCVICLTLSQVNTSFALPNDRTQPVTIEAKTAELNEQTNTAVYGGNVVITQGTLKITGDKVTIKQDATGSVESFVATGNQAYYEQLPEQGKELIKAHAKQITYTAHNGHINLSDNAKILQGSNSFSGNTITYDTLKRTVIALSNQNERVKVIIQPTQK